MGVVVSFQEGVGVVEVEGLAQGEVRKHKTKHINVHVQELLF